MSKMTPHNRKRAWQELPSRIFADDASGKDLEAKLMREFLRTMRISRYTLLPRERPDFWIQFAEENRQVLCGCELTLFNSDSIIQTSKGGSAERRFFSQWNEFARKLRADILQSNRKLASVYGAVFFNQSRLDIFDEYDEATLRKEIVDILQSWSGQSRIERFDPKRHPLLSTYVEHIFVEDTAVQDGPLWWCAHLQSGTIPNATKALAEIISNKCERARNYDWDDATKRWLVICARATGLADVGFIQENPMVVVRPHMVPYTEIFFWERAFGTVIEVFPTFRARNSSEGMPEFYHALRTARRPRNIQRPTQTKGTAT